MTGKIKTILTLDSWRLKQAYFWVCTSAAVIFQNVTLHIFEAVVTSQIQVLDHTHLWQPKAGTAQELKSWSSNTTKPRFKSSRLAADNLQRTRGNTQPTVCLRGILHRKSGDSLLSSAFPLQEERKQSHISTHLWSELCKLCQRFFSRKARRKQKHQEQNLCTSISGCTARLYSGELSRAMKI